MSVHKPTIQIQKEWAKKGKVRKLVWFYSIYSINQQRKTDMLNRNVSKVQRRQNQNEEN